MIGEKIHEILPRDAVIGTNGDTTLKFINPIFGYRKFINLELLKFSDVKETLDYIVLVNRSESESRIANSETHASKIDELKKVLNVVDVGTWSFPNNRELKIYKRQTQP